MGYGLPGRASVFFSSCMFIASTLPSQEWRMPWGQVPARRDHAMAYDTARSRAVVFSGRGAGGLLCDTWEWDGQFWGERTSTNSPPAMSGAAMVFDRHRAVCVLFGTDGSTWEWNGFDWSQRHVPQSPSARQGHAMAFDLRRGRTVLFGGVTGQGWSDDTWEWDGTDWTLRSTPVHPRGVPLSANALAFDETRNVTILCTGAGAQGRAETWAWDGTAWAQLFPAVSPWSNPASMAYDPVRHRIVAYQTGRSTWEWDGSTWIDATIVVFNPSAYLGYTVVHDARRGKILLFGGENRDSAALSQTWEYDGRWIQIALPPMAPSARIATAAFDEQRGEMVLFGGGDRFGRFLADTWSWTGTAWHVMESRTRPPGRFGHGMAWDPAARKVTLFGGRLSAGLADDTTWQWDGADWTRLQPLTRPSARSSPLVADLGRGRVVLFGGEDNNHQLLADTWEWDGSNWLSRSPRSAPSARSEHAMAYDPVRRRAVLFSGGPVADTWEWDGTDWMEILPRNSPPAQSGHRMAFDGRLGYVVMLGQVNNNSNTWAWDGTDWADLGPNPALAGRDGPAMDYDPAREQIVLFGGNGGPAEYADTWVFTSRPARTAILGGGCGGGAVVPALAALGLPQLRSRAFALDLYTGRPEAPVLFGFAPSSGNFSIGGGCAVYLGLDLFLVAGLATNRGLATLRVPIPSEPGLRSSPIFAQGLVLDPSAVPNGLALSAALVIVVGD